MDPLPTEAVPSVPQETSAPEIPDKSAVEDEVAQSGADGSQHEQSLTEENRLATELPDISLSLPEPVPVAPSLPELAPAEPHPQEPAPVTRSVPASIPIDIPADTSQSPAARRYTKDDRLRAKAKKLEQMEAVLGAIMTYATEKYDALALLGDVGISVSGITNDEVEELTGVSDTTAAKYLKELVTRGVLQKVGVGRGVKYTTSVKN